MSQALPADLINPSEEDLIRASNDNIRFTSPEQLYRFWKRKCGLSHLETRLTSVSLHGTKELCYWLVESSIEKFVLASMGLSTSRQHYF
jgi:hypothetical protein